MTYITLFNWTEKVEVEKGYYVVTTFFTDLCFILIIVLIVLIVMYRSRYSHMLDVEKRAKAHIDEYQNKIHTIKKTTKNEKDKKIFELEDKVKQLEQERDMWQSKYYDNKMDSNALANAIKDGIAKAKYEEKTGIFGSADDILDSSKHNFK